MSSVLHTIKRIILWSYGRTTWQYDVLCALIVAFVFLTPKTWFEQGKLDGRGLHQNGFMAAERLFLRPEVLGPNPDAQAVERGVQRVTGRPGLKVRSWRALRTEDGQIAVYEVDIE